MRITEFIYNDEMGTIGLIESFGSAHESHPSSSFLPVIWVSSTLIAILFHHDITRQHLRFINYMVGFVVDLYSVQFDLYGDSALLLIFTSLDIVYIFTNLAKI